MAGRRFIVDCFIPDDTWASIPSATKTAIRDRIRQLKQYAVGLQGEATPRATWHTCYHDEPTPRPCEPEQDI